MRCQQEARTLNAATIRAFVSNCRRVIADRHSAKTDVLPAVRSSYIGSSDVRQLSTPLMGWSASSSSCIMRLSNRRRLRCHNVMCRAGPRSTELMSVRTYSTSSVSGRRRASPESSVPTRHAAAILRASRAGDCRDGILRWLSMDCQEDTGAGT